MHKKLALVLAAAAAVVMISWQAQATPMATAKHGYQTQDITLVANGCGRGWHWSAVLGRCVRN